MKSRTIKVDYLARVEGEAALYVKIKDNMVVDIKFKIFEPPRFFEAFLRGRSFNEAPDITARICGICPIAYQMSFVHAMEDAFGVTVDGQLRALRRLIFCGEWIESHTLHVYLLHAPDFLGYPDAIQMAKDYPDIVQRGLQLKKAGNALVALLGGREIHPINGLEMPLWKLYAGLPRLIFLTLNRTMNSLHFVTLKNIHSMREGLFQTRDWIFPCTTMIITL